MWYLMTDDPATWLCIRLFQHSQRSWKGQGRHEVCPPDDQHIKGAFARNHIASAYLCFCHMLLLHYFTEFPVLYKGDDVSEKSWNVREFECCQENVWEFGKSQEKILSGKMCPRIWMVYNFIVSSIPTLLWMTVFLSFVSIYFGSSQNKS